MKDITELLDIVADAFSKGRAQQDHSMRIPADPEHDGDIICSAGAAEIRALRTANARLRAALKRKELARITGECNG